MDEKQVSQILADDLIPNEYHQLLTDMFLILLQVHLEPFEDDRYRLHLLEERAALVEQALQRR